MIVTCQREKLLNLIVYFVKNTKRCFKTKLLKLLYFADFIHFRETGESITGLTYYAWPKGPVPVELFSELKKPKDDFKEHLGILGVDDKLKLIPKKKFDNRYFSKRELGIIEKVATIFRDADTDTMVESTHLLGEPWHKTMKEKGKNAAINYELAFDGSKGALTKEEYLERKKEKDFLRNALL